MKPTLIILCWCVATVVIALSCLPAYGQLTINFVPVNQTTNPLITGQLDVEPHPQDLLSNRLLNILEHTGDVFGDAFEVAHTIEITYLWDEDADFAGQAPTNLVFEQNGLITHSVVRFHPTGFTWFIDDTPANDSEFNPLQQVLYESLSLADQTDRFAGDVPDVFEAGFNATAPAGSPASGGGTLDLLTVAFQEVGHAIGMSSGFSGLTNGSGFGEADDGDFDIPTGWVNGDSMQLLPILTGTNGPLAHLAGNDAVMGGLAGGERTRPSTADYMAIAVTNGWTVSETGVSMLDLPRKDFLAASGDWRLGSGWLGGAVPDIDDDVYVRNGGDVTIAFQAQLPAPSARNLTIQNGSSVDTNNNWLTVANKVTVEAGPDGGADASLVIDTSGRIIAGEVEVNDGGNVAISGSMFNPRVHADVIDINAGGVLVGHGMVAAFDLTNDGTITAINLVDSNTMRLVGNLGEVDLDGVSGLGKLFAVLGNIEIVSSLSDAFDGEITVGATRHVDFEDPWELGRDGTINLNGGANTANSAAIEGAPMTANWGQINVTGFGEVDADAALGATGALNVDINVAANGNLAFSGTTIVEDAEFSVGNGAILHFEGPTTVDSADFSFSGNGQAQFIGETTYSFNTAITSNGLIRQTGDATIVGSMTVNGGVFDLDGTSAIFPPTINLGNAGNSGSLTLNVDAIDATNNIFSGTIETQQAGFGTLTINLTNPAAAWTMNGTLNLHGNGFTQVAGSRMSLTGQLNITDSSVRINADTDFSIGSSTSFAAASSELHMHEVTRIFGGSFSGSGTLVNGSSGDMTLADGVNTGSVKVENNGSFRIGNSAGSANVNQFTQNASGVWEVELGGTMAGVTFDQLVASGRAFLGGTLDVLLIDGYAPALGTTHTILETQAGVVLGTFDTEILPIFAGRTFEVIYNAKSVVLQVIEAPFLPGDFDFDGDVDGRDFLLWQRGGSPNPLSASDLADWQANYGTTQASAVTAVPEPATTLLLCMGAVSSLACRRRDRRVVT